MPTVKSPAKIKVSAEKIITVWSKNPDLKVSGTTLPDLQARLDALLTALSDIEREEQRSTLVLTPLRNHRDDLVREINRLCVTARKSVAGSFGENSTEYELAGGTRTSARRSTGKRAKAAPPKS